MDSLVEIYLERANNEVMAAESLKRLSEQNEDKKNFDLPLNTSFYSSVISHSYYAIFYSTKALLLTKNIKTSSPEVHKKTFEVMKIKDFQDTKNLHFCVSLRKILWILES